MLTNINTISYTQHQNIVESYSCCVEGDHAILVCSYIDNNSSLAHTLLGKCIIIFLVKFSRRQWTCIYQNLMTLNHTLQVEISTLIGKCRICIGIASGLAFLHEEVQPHIVHGELTSTNILLDKDLTPKISDVGLSKLISVTRVIITA